MMKKTEEELLSVQYRIEKSGIKQQKLENRLVSISSELRKSKRNSMLFMIFLLTVIMAMGGVMYYLNTGKSKTDATTTNSTYVTQIQKSKDSLYEELAKLKMQIATYQEKLQVANDSITNIVSLNGSTDQINENQNVVNDSVNDSSKIPFYKNQHAIVNKVFRKDGTVFIETDYIEYFEGKEAVKRAKENDEAEYDIDKNGDTLYFLYNNYYVHNKNPLIRILELDDKVRIEDINQIANGFPIKAFQKIIADKPILILGVDNGIVYKIKKQRLP